MARTRLKLESAAGSVMCIVLLITYVAVELGGEHVDAGVLHPVGRELLAVRHGVRGEVGDGHDEDQAPGLDRCLRWRAYMYIDEHASHLCEPRQTWRSPHPIRA